jgi:hypothetical protein
LPRWRVDGPYFWEAERALAAQPLQRPKGWSLVRYSVGGAVDLEHSSWVLNDTTGRTWILRHFARVFAIVNIPFFVLYMLFSPGPEGMRLFTGLTFSAGLLLITTLVMLIDSDRRAVKAGFHHELVSDIRSASSVERQRAANFERRERLAARRGWR